MKALPDVGHSLPGVEDWRILGQVIAGDVVSPAHPDYDEVRRAALKRFHGVLPLAVVRCRSEGDVSAALSLARRSGTDFAIRSGGHDFAGRSSSRGIVIDVGAMSTITVAGELATVQAGARLADVYRALGAYGRTIPAGSGPSVGIAGLTLGGGLGMLGRKYGLTCDRLVQARIVLADGKAVTCSETARPDLFWAPRGGGSGYFGIVTTLAFTTVPAPWCTTFELHWGHQHAVQVVQAWQSSAPDGPKEFSASLLLTTPADPTLPPRVRVIGIAALDTHKTGAILDAFVSRVGATPTRRTQRTGSWATTSRSLTGIVRNESSGHQFSRSGFFKQSLPAATIAALAAQLSHGRIQGIARELDFTPWGGAYNRPATQATAFPHRAERFLVKHTMTVEAESVDAAPQVETWLERSWRTIHPWGTGGVYANFPDPKLSEPARAYFGPNLEQLRRVKRDYDPDRVFPGLPEHANPERAGR